MNGQIYGSGDMLMLKSCGKCEGPNGTYELLIDQQGQPVVRSETSMRKFKLSWENIVEFAVENGVDDKGPTYSIQCEGGRFTNGKLVSVAR